MGRRLNALAVFGLLLHICSVVSVTPAAEQEPGTTEATSELQGCPQVSSALTIPFRACYIQESKVLPLLAQISAVPKMLNHNENSASSPQVQVKHVPKLEEHGMCSTTEIQLLKKELVWITRQLWQLSNRLEEPVDAQIQSLRKREIDLVRHLRNLVVYTGDSPASGMQLVSFNTRVDLLDAGFKEAFATLEAHRPLRNVTTESILAAIESQAVYRSKEYHILDPMRTIAELMEISETNPQEMSAALPRLISNMYAGMLANFNRTLQLVNNLRALKHRLIGYTSLYDEMRKSSHLETYELTLLAAQLKAIRDYVLTHARAESVPPALLERYTNMVDELRTLYKLINETTTCKIINVKYQLGINCCADESTNLADLRDISVISSTPADQALFEFAIYETERLYSSDTLSLSDSKRGVTEGHPYAGVFKEWKLIPVQGGKYFKILNAKYDEVLYADKTLTVSSSPELRRVLLAKNTYSGPRVYGEEEAHWLFQCPE